MKGELGWGLGNVVGGINGALRKQAAGVVLAVGCEVVHVEKPQ
jgi:hypothetical protein